MIAIKAVKLASGVLIVLASFNAYAQSSEAGAMASPAPSAKSARAENRALGKKVRAALAKANGIDVANISVRVRGSAVSLSGSVPNASQVGQATTVVKGLPGVASVDNHLTIRSEEGGQ
ncbi:BON domain-containing protein [Caballeronia sordidicola]|uniref:Putative periplasmic or secreted lipoprotein n=1 Tax=Caballeronia sordidicola TaxID=196367 RepID=A0A242MBN4_CABSO|nr:BON domain-containing protein [Caballeronia sordidicola]OTP68707.1 putative periplasmic or secreted lipoprotein [Caballeronia sordidicola]